MGRAMDEQTYTHDSFQPRQSNPEPVNAPTSPEEWVDNYGDYLYRVALVRVRNPVLAEDLVQETFLAGIASRKSFAGRSSEKTWLVGILKHKIIDHFRKSTREKPTEDVGDMLDPNDDMYVWNHWSISNRPKRWEGDPPDAAEAHAFWAVLHECLAEVPDRLRQAFSMREIDDCSSDEICKELEITSTNLWVMLHRARARLRKCLEHKWLSGNWKVVS